MSSIQRFHFCNFVYRSRENSILKVFIYTSQCSNFSEPSQFSAIFSSLVCREFFCQCSKVPTVLQYIHQAVSQSGRTGFVPICQHNMAYLNRVRPHFLVYQLEHSVLIVIEYRTIYSTHFRSRCELFHFRIKGIFCKESIHVRNF